MQTKIIRQMNNLFNWRKIALKSIQFLSLNVRLFPKTFNSEELKEFPQLCIRRTANIS